MATHPLRIFQRLETEKASSLTQPPGLKWPTTRPKPKSPWVRSTWATRLVCTALVALILDVFLLVFEDLRLGSLIHCWVC